MRVIEKIDALRKLMRREGMDAYIIPTDDYHASEYVGEYFKEREYMSGFTGSAGTLLVMENEAALWTDGRYFIQAEAELRCSGIRLMKSGCEGTPDMEDYLFAHMPDCGVVGFDGRTVACGFADRLAAKCRGKSVTFVWNKDLVDEIWENRPQMSAQPVWELPISYAGISRSEKLCKIREVMQEKNADYLLLTALDDIAWTLNLRGDDIAYTPVFLSYMLIEKEGGTLCVNEEIIGRDIRMALTGDGIKIVSYDYITELLHSLKKGSVLMMDRSAVSVSLFACIPNAVKIMDEINVISSLKAVKNKTEEENIRKAHIKDGVAVTKFIYWFKQNVGKIHMTELAVAEKLTQFRQKADSFIEPSFETIAAYGEHGAIIHYEPSPDTDAEIKPYGFLLTDSGGHYMEGTTDISRTIACGSLSEEEKRNYTLTLKGHLALAAAVFPDGATGENLDILAREPLWREGLDYNHGTGHGVGYLLNVHEGPQRIGWRIKHDGAHTPLACGMVVSDEPGLYLPGRYGIRHENLLMCKEKEINSYGRFLHFDILTQAPFDRDAIMPELLNEDELAILNSYHNRVYNNISPYLSEDEMKWLAEVTETF